MFVSEFTCLVERMFVFTYGKPSPQILSAQFWKESSLVEAANV
jgi:hypothetical protein